MQHQETDPVTDPAGRDVLRLAAAVEDSLEGLLARYGLALTRVAAGTPIPGSYWGDEEAGLQGDRLLARPDTPVHSVLHEACHFVCMTPERRNSLDTDAGGEYGEENAVCYLQVLLADFVSGFDRQRMFQDMDRWGYTFRLGSAQAWFEEDAQDARDFLRSHQLIDKDDAPTWKLRKT
jgi:hypothetical protein